METRRKFIMQSFRSVSLYIISTDEDPDLRIESFAVINLRGVSTDNSIITSKLLCYSNV